MNARELGCRDRCGGKCSPSGRQSELFVENSARLWLLEVTSRLQIRQPGLAIDTVRRRVVWNADVHIHLNAKPAAVLLVCSLTLSSQSKSSKTDDVVQRLMQDGFPPRIVQLSASERAVAVQQLQTAQLQARGRRAQKIAFLLASLGSDYQRNLHSLVLVLGSCPSSDDCDEDTAALLIGLYNSGNREVLLPLMAVGMKSDGALSEMLGPFYCDVLINTPSEFMDGLRRLDSPSQKAVCGLAGALDGGGMPPDTLRVARKRLDAVDDEVTLRCLHEVEVSNSMITAEE